MPEIQRTALPYWQWEDHAAGMYGLTYTPRQVVEAQALLTDPERLRLAMKYAVEHWPNAALHQMSNAEQNRRAWLGWAACMVNNLVPACATKVAWSNLSDAQRRAANGSAELVIFEWEREHADVPVEFQPSLFDFPGDDNA
jgi:hypothetical protein